MYYEYKDGTIFGDRHTYEDNTIYLYKDNILVAKIRNVAIEPYDWKIGERTVKCFKIIDLK